MISTTEPTIANSIWVNGIQVENDGTFEGLDHVTYNADTHTLTLDGASAQDGMLSLSTTDVHPEPMIVCNGDLIVQLTGNNSVSFNGDYSNYVFKNIGSSGTLTITQSGTDATMSITTEYSDGDSKGLCNGFSAVNFEGGLAYRVRSGSRTISTLDLASPDFYVVNPDENEYSFQLTNGLLYGTSNGAIVGAEYFYKITYADSSIEGSGVEHKLTLDNTSYNIDASQKIHVDNLEPCTIEAYTKLNGETSTANKAKKFGPAEETMRLVYGADPVDFVLAPAIEESDGIKVNGIEANVTYNSTTGKVSSSILGSHGAIVTLTYTGGGYTAGNTLLLNYYFDMSFVVVPPAPTISLPAGEYLNTHANVTVTGAGLANTTIKYKWDDDAAIDYTAEGIPLQTGTLNAWVEYTDESTTLSSDITSVAYTMKNDIADAYVMDIEDVAYTGSAVTPTIVVKASESAEATILTAGTDYTVTYKQGETAVAATELINAGTYTAVITGTGSYGSETEAEFTITPKVTTLTVVLTNPDEAITYDGTAKTPAITVKDGNTVLTATTDYTITGYSNNTNAATSNAATPPTVTIAGAGNYNGSTGSTTFTINKATLTVTPDDKTYNVGDAIPTLTVQYSGFVNGEGESTLLKTPTASYGDADVTKPGSYTITVSGGEAQNYEFVYETGTLTINRDLNIEFADNQTWATYYATENLTLPEGLKAYILTEVDKTSGEVTVQPVSYIPENQAVLLEKTGTSSRGFVSATYTGTTTSITNNLLIGSVDAKAISNITGGTVYVLYNDVFKRATSGTIPARRAYLVVRESASARLKIVHGGNSTAIENIIIDDADDSWYAIDGRKLNGKPQRAGFYIKNGKKVYIK
jgi:hypothetical protein